MKPNRLINGALIGICAPSGTIKEENRKDLIRASKLLEKYKFKILYSNNLFSNSLGYSASVKEKSSDLNELIKNKEVNAIIFAKGGSNCNSILDCLDYGAIKINPKFIIGFSDNTVLLNAIYKKTGLVTYHFTNFKNFCEKNLEYNIKQFENVMINGYKGEVEHASNWITIREGKSNGKLVGGNLTSLIKILNTEYCPDFKDNILFLEDLSIESDIEMVSSNLYQLKQANVFDKISGLLLGSYDTKQSGITFERVVMDVLSDYKFPIIKCDDFGHTNNNMVLPIGILCTLDANNRKLIYEERTSN